MSPIENSRASGWRDHVLGHFSEDIAAACRVTVVADPDGLLRDDAVADVLIQAGFDVVLYRDPIDFRFYYESRHRNQWDAGHHSSVVISAEVSKLDIGVVPHDVLALARASRRVFELSLARLFPGLSCDVLADIERSDLDDLWQATSLNEAVSLGQGQTRDLVLRAVYKLASEMIATPTDLLTQLIRLHQNERIVPIVFAQRFEEGLSNREGLGDWPIAELTVSSDRFYGFLQEHWPGYVASIGAEPGETELKSSAQCDVDFGAPELSTAVTDFFVTGRLRPIDVEAPSKLSERWEHVGVRYGSELETVVGVRKAIISSLESLPDDSCSGQAWLNYALRWGELSRLIADLDASARATVDSELCDCRTRADAQFLSWLNDKFATLINRSFLPTPTMVHQAAHFLAHRKKPGNKVALIVVDGMSVSNWLTIKHVAGDVLRKKYRIIESAAFAWVPTITSVSRQAIFSGHTPFFFESSVQTTSAEEKLWRSFWEDRNWRRNRIALIKHQANEHESSLNDRVQASIENDRTECLAVAVNSIDRMVHGAPPEENVLNATLKTWAENQHLAHLIAMCVDSGYEVVVTADHGNVYAKGMGRPNVGSVPDGRGHRALIFPNEVTLDQARESTPGTIQWGGAGLPESMHVLIPERREAFVNQSGVICTHGGASLDEVLVPFIQVSRL